MKFLDGQPLAIIDIRRALYMFQDLTNITFYYDHNQHKTDSTINEVLRSLEINKFVVRNKDITLTDSEIDYIRRIRFPQYFVDVISEIKEMIGR